MKEQLELATRLHGLGSESAEAVRIAQDAYDDTLTDLTAAESSLATLRNSQVLRLDSDRQERRNNELSVLQAELALEEAREDLASLSVAAPFDGVVAAVNVVEGSAVSDQQVLLNLIDDTVLRLPVQIDETQIGKIALGLSAEVQLDALPGETFSGTVSGISPVARSESNIPIFDVTVTLRNPDLVMRPGMTAEAEITVKEIAEAVSLPSSAVLRRPDGAAAVRVSSADGGAIARSVSVVDTVGFNTIVSGELADGEMVLLPAATSSVAAGRAGGGQNGNVVLGPGAGPGAGRGGFPGGGPAVRIGGPQ
jgi:HlyD family secretion protein